VPKEVLRDEKILLTGPTGQIGLPMGEYLAADNEVWGLARFSDPAAARRLQAAGIRPCPADLAAGELGELPDDFTYVVHLAAFQQRGLDYDHALRVNAEGTGLLLAHCRRAKAALVASTFSVYAPQPDPYRELAETDPLGDSHPPHSQTYSVSKIAEEAVARLASKLFGLPVTIARINATYGPNGGLPAYHLDALAAGHPVRVRAPGPNPYSPIHQDDLNGQVAAMLDAASVPATVVNWAGDEVVTAEEWCRYLGSLVGAQPRLDYRDHPLGASGAVADNSRRRHLVGPCQVGWREGMREMAGARHPSGKEDPHQ
jgi:nucleoside-diphosphate-sugar epimerase